MSILKRALPPLISLAILFCVIYFVTPPKSWIDASLTQILVFFIPLLILFTALIDLILKYPPKSFSIALGLMVLFVLHSIDSLNPITLILTLLATFLLSSAFKKERLSRLSKRSKRSKLTR